MSHFRSDPVTGAPECDCAVFHCPHAPEGRFRCGSICDCFIEQYPEDPFGLHPEAFLVNGHQMPAIGGPQNENGHNVTCPGCSA